MLHNNTAKKRRRRGEIDDVVDDDVDDDVDVDDKNATQEDDESFDINDFISNVS